MRKTERKRSVRNDKITFTKKMRTQVHTLAGVGFTVEEMADYLGISKATFDRRMQEDEELREAVRTGRTRSKSTMYQKAYKYAESFKNPNFTKFYLQSRYGWKVKNELEHSGAVETVDPEAAFQEKLNGMTEEELRDFVAEGLPNDGSD